jgi:hypothetical protein
MFFKNAFEVLGTLVELQDSDERVPQPGARQFIGDQVQLIFAYRFSCHVFFLLRWTEPIERRRKMSAMLPLVLAWSTCVMPKFFGRQARALLLTQAN